MKRIMSVQHILYKCTQKVAHFDRSKVISKSGSQIVIKLTMLFRKGSTWNYYLKEGKTLATSQTSIILLSNR